MANPTNLPGDLVVPGSLTVRGAVNIGTSANASPAGMQHEHRADFSQANSAAAAETRVIATIRGASGSLKSFVAGSIVAATGNSTTTLDLQKSTGGGAYATVLSAPIVLDNANAAAVVEAATISSAPLVAGDTLRVVQTIFAGTGTLPTGVFAEARFVEDYSG